MDSFVNSNKSAADDALAAYIAKHGPELTRKELPALATFLTDRLGKDKVLESITGSQLNLGKRKADPTIADYNPWTTDANRARVMLRHHFVGTGDLLPETFFGIPRTRNNSGEERSYLSQMLGL